MEVKVLEMEVNNFTGKRVKIGIVDTGISKENYSMISENIIGGYNRKLCI